MQDNGQMTFEFNMKSEFVSYKGTCNCGQSWEFKKSTLALELIAPCPKCGKLIVVKGPSKN